MPSPPSPFEADIPFAYVEYAGDGSNRVFNVPFDYITEDHVKVYVDGVLVSAEFLSHGSIQLAIAPASDAVVLIRRETPIEEPVIVFNTPSALTATRLNLANKQLVLAIQEAIDYASEARVGLDEIDGVVAQVQALADQIGDAVEAITGSVPLYADSMAAMRSTFSVVQPSMVTMLGYYQRGDMGVVSVYRWNAGSSAADNGGTVVKPTGIVGNGRYELVIGEVLYMAQFGILADGDGLGNGTDNSPQFTKMTGYIGTRGRLKLIAPDRGVIGITKHHFISHCGYLVVRMNECKIQNISTNPSEYGNNLWWGNDYFTNRAPGLEGFTGTIQLPFPVATVAEGAHGTTLATPSLAVHFPPGTRALLMGYEQQGYGYPFNLRYFEPVVIRTSDTGTGALTWDRATQFAYNEDWFAMVYSGGWITGGGYTDVLGPAAIIPLDRSLRYGQEYLEIDNLEYLPNISVDTTPLSTFRGDAQYSSESPYFQGWDKVRLGRVKLGQCAVGQCGDMRIDHLTCVDLQLDKLVGRMHVEAGTITKCTDGTGVRKTTFGPGVTIRFNSTVTGPEVEYLGCHFTNPDASTGNRPLSMAFSNSADSFKAEGCTFDWDDQSAPIFGGNFQEDVTYPDRPGIYMVEAVSVAAGTFNVAFGDGTARILLRKGTVLTRASDKAQFVVSDITYDGTPQSPGSEDGDFVVHYVSDAAVASSDVLWFYPVLKIEIGGNNSRTGKYRRLPLMDGKITGQQYTNTDDGFTRNTVDFVARDFAVGGSTTKFFLDATIQEIEVNITKAASSGLSSGNLTISVQAPNGISFTPIVINTKVAGRRRILPVSSVNAKSGDTLTDLGYDRYMMAAGISVTDSANKGDAGYKGYVRFIGTRGR